MCHLDLHVYKIGNNYDADYPKRRLYGNVIHYAIFLVDYNPLFYDKRNSHRRSFPNNVGRSCLIEEKRGIRRRKMGVDEELSFGYTRLTDLLEVLRPEPAPILHSITEREDWKRWNK